MSTDAVTITIDATLFERIRTIAESRGEDPNRYAVAAIASIVEQDELAAEADPDSDLTEAERAARDAGIARGDRDFAEGRFRTLDEVIADKKARFGLNI